MIKFELSNQGICSFDENIHYQLQTNSRLSFLGCWLSLQPVLADNVKVLDAKYNTSNKQLFIYRDSLNQQDYARLSRVIRQLNSDVITL